MWWAIGSTLIWGVGGLLAYYAARDGSGVSVWATATVIEASVAIPFLITHKPTFTWTTVGVGVTGAIAYAMYFLALRGQTAAAPVVAVTAMYPVVTALLAVAVTQQQLSIRQWVGVALAVVAGWLVFKE